MNKRDFFLLGANLMREEIEDRLVEDPEALAPVRVRGYPWGYALRLRADARLGFGCRDEEFVELRYGAGNRHGTVARRCRHNCAFIKWDDQDRVDYGEFGDWRWWWNLKPEAA